MEPNSSLPCSQGQTLHELTEFSPRPQNPSFKIQFNIIIQIYAQDS
jgi:hypothetical protein